MRRLDGQIDGQRCAEPTDPIDTAEVWTWTLGEPYATRPRSSWITVLVAMRTRLLLLG